MLLARSEFGLQKDRIPRSLKPVALVVLGDRVRDDAADTLRFFADQGVAAKVISGDHPDTVGAIAREVGVPGSHEVIDARELPDDPEHFADIVEQASVFGRVTPHQKRAMVGALQGRGHVVAMTGDGVNDVLALKDADIGIAIGTGSPASRAVAQLVLIDGSFATLPGVVAEGRRVIGNIERVANLFVTKTVYAIFLAIAIGVAARPFPFLPRHLTLVGMVTIGIPAFFLALAPTAKRARTGFVKRVLRFAIPTGLAAGLATYGAYELAITEAVNLAEARTTATLVLAALGLFALGMVGRPLEGWKKALLWAMAGLLLLLLLSSPSQDFFELDTPPIVVLMAGVGVVAITGTVMVGTLRAVGWLEYLRRHPPEPRQTWNELTSRVRVWLDTRETRPALVAAASPPEEGEEEEEGAPPQQPPPHRPEPAPAASAGDVGTEPDQPEPAPGLVEWFDPDEDPLSDIEYFDPEHQED